MLLTPSVSLVRGDSVACKSVNLAKEAKCILGAPTFLEEKDKALMMYFSTTLAAKLAFLLSFFISIFGRYKHLDHGSPNIEPVFFVSHNKIKSSEMQ